MSDYSPAIYQLSVNIQQLVNKLDSYVEGYLSELITADHDHLLSSIDTGFDSLDHDIEAVSESIDHGVDQILTVVNRTDLTVSGIDSFLRNVMDVRLAKVEAGVEEIQETMEDFSTELSATPAKTAALVNLALENQFNAMAVELQALRAYLVAAIDNQTNRIEAVIAAGDKAVASSIDSQTKAVTTQMVTLGAVVAQSVTESGTETNKTLKALTVMLDDRLAALTETESFYRETMITFVQEYWSNYISSRRTLNEITPDTISTAREQAGEITVTLPDTPIEVPVEETLSQEDSLEPYEQERAAIMTMEV